MKKEKSRSYRKTGLVDPLDPKVVKPRMLSEERERNLFNFKAPAYDRRSSYYIEAGTDYGVGFAQPVGHVGRPKDMTDVIPFGRPKTLRVDEI